jgi:hypothetical protein
MGSFDLPAKRATEGPPQILLIKLDIAQPKQRNTLVPERLCFMMLFLRADIPSTSVLVIR